MRCQTDNFIVPKKNGAYFIFLLISILFGVFIFLLPNIGFAMATYNPARETYSIGLLPVIAGGFFGLGAARVMMNIFNWVFGSVSQDRKYKSAADFE